MDIRGRGSRAVVVVAGLLGAVTCRSVPRELSNLPCDQGRCGGQHSCDTVTGICVTTGDACEEEDRTSACLDDQARMCERGTWTDCGALGSECTPGTSICDSNNLIVCDGRGFIRDARGCGPPGCNNLADPPRCNLCVPNSRVCNGLVFTLCAADGLIASQEDCATGAVCSGAGICDPSSGCGVLAQSPAGTPCDEGGGLNGNFCDSECQSGQCVAGRTPVCDDQKECTTDTCAPASGCVFTNRPAYASCGGGADLCASSCDGAGECVAVPVDCASIGLCVLCNSATGACTEMADNSVVCRPTAGDCDLPERCPGGSFDCPADSFVDSTVVCRASAGVCDLADNCPGDGPACPDALASVATECRAGGGTCDPAEACTTGTAFCAADVQAGDGTSCNDCAEGGACDPVGCEAGLCPDPCDGLAGSAQCVVSEDCVTCRTTGECERLACVGGVAPVVREHQLCADASDGVNWGPTRPCVAVTCHTEDSNDGPDAIEADCFSRASNDNSKTTRVQYTFSTRAPNGTPYNLWMRNIADDSWDSGEQYDCTLSGVNGSASYGFSFVEGDLDNASRHGRGCGDFDFTSRYCWMAVDGDATAANGYQPLLLDQGQHILDCTIVASGDGSEDGGFDGILFTTELGYVPSEVGTSAACGDSDQAFSGAQCAVLPSVNWGPNSPGNPEHFSCADVADAVSFGQGKPCDAVSCLSESATRLTGATNQVGSDCYGSNTTVEIRYRFNTTSPSGTPFMIWMRNAVDDEWDAGEDYRCELTGVTGVADPFVFFYYKADLDNYGRYGAGCGDFGGAPYYCWMAADRDTERTNGPQPIQLDAGLHVLRCDITTNNANEHAGFDGLLVTTNTSFLPDVRDGPVACENRDAKFSAGHCNWLWGPNLAPIDAVVGACAVEPTIDGQSCSGSNVCCDGSCQASCP